MVLVWAVPAGAVPAAAVIGCVAGEAAAQAGASADGAASPAAGERAPLEARLDAVIALPAQAQLEAQARLVRQVLDESVDLERVLRDAQAPSPRRSLAAWLLGELDVRGACERLTRPLPEPVNDELDLAWVLARARCGELPPLRAMLRAGDPLVRVKTAIMLGLLGDTQSLRAVRALLEDEQVARYLPFVQLAAGLLGDADQRDALTVMLRDRNMRAHAAIALGRMGVGSVVYDLHIALRDPDSVVRFAALSVLFEQRMPGSLQPIRPLVDDPDPRTARLARRAIRDWDRVRGR